ncbi:hypothetical protein K9M47_03750 [Candidatus Gracilibacteria bacterium]|nr:hypothetical protein [Candidatus Gracilibacteria bacterium]MCF7898517.1 hypothetical protein [Candidatus Paceibacterota bacterium]
MSTHYIAENRKELFEASSAEIKNLIKGGEVNSVATALAKAHNFPIGKYEPLANTISFVLIGALQPKDVVTALVDGFQLSEEEATAIAEELEKSIFEKARMITLGKSGDEVTKLEFKGERTPDELRKELMDTTKQASALKIPQTSGIPKKTAVAAPGSRSQLMEQLQILGKIPNDEEIEERLKNIQKQISSIKKVEESNTLDSNIALKSFMFGEEGKETAPAVLKTATYSVAPTHYNLDPYREIAED